LNLNYDIIELIINKTSDKKTFSSWFLTNKRINDYLNTRGKWLFEKFAYKMIPLEFWFNPSPKLAIPFITIPK
jgi:hypothetical protein